MVGFNIWDFVVTELYGRLLNDCPDIAMPLLFLELNSLGDSISYLNLTFYKRIGGN